MFSMLQWQFDTYSWAKFYFRLLFLYSTESKFVLNHGKALYIWSRYADRIKARPKFTSYEISKCKRHFHQDNIHLSTCLAIYSSHCLVRDCHVSKFGGNHQSSSMPSGLFVTEVFKFVRSPRSLLQRISKAWFTIVEQSNAPVLSILNINSSCGKQILLVFKVTLPKLIFWTYWCRRPLGCLKTLPYFRQNSNRPQ